MLKNVLVALTASAFAMGAYAQAQKAEPKGQTGAATQAATPADGKGEAKRKAKPSKTKSAKAKPAQESKKDTK